MHWVWVGPNGRTTRPSSGGVLPFYTLCAAEADRHVKTIANTFFLEGLDVHPHNFRFRSAPLPRVIRFPVATTFRQPHFRQQTTHSVASAKPPIRGPHCSDSSRCQ